MIEKPKGRFVDKQDNDLPDSFEKLIEKYGLENVWEYIEKYWNDVEGLTTDVSQALTDIDTLKTDVQELQPIDSLDSTSTTRPLSANQGKVLDEKTDLRITTGSEVATNEYIDNKQVYRKRISIGNLPNSTNKYVSTGLLDSEVNLIDVRGFAVAKTSTFSYGLTLPDISPSDASAATRLTMDTDNGIWRIRIQTGVDRSNYVGNVDLYYTKIQN